MKILFIYAIVQPRKTVLDSVFCFKKYQKRHKIFYYNYNSGLNIIPIIKNQNFDMIVFHNTFMCIRWTSKKMKEVIKEFSEFWKKSSKAVIMQDEYIANNLVIDFINKLDVDIIFSLGKKNATEKLYPKEKIGNKKIVKILTGYVDRESVTKVNKLQKKIVRDIDIGYRGGKVNFSMGEIGLLKTKIPEKFNDFAKKYPEMKIDIKNTLGNKNLFLGEDWIKFLLRCRTMVGCLGGSSILDADGTLYRKYIKLMNERFGSDYYEKIKDELEERHDTDLDYTAISPRCFECAMTRTCQLLVEGDYEGIMLPGKHFIEIKRDFSNLKEVIEKVKDKTYCEKIAENAYKDLIESHKYDYSRYVNLLLFHMENQIRGKEKSSNSGLDLSIVLLFNDLIGFWKNKILYK